MPFRDIVGHRHLLDLVAGAATRASLPPSLIFAGPQGVGKRASALALAQFVNCPTRVQSKDLAASGLLNKDLAAPDLLNKDLAAPDLLIKDLAAPDLLINDACGTCASCTRIARLVHADVFLVEPGDTGVIKVDQVREVVERTAYRPFEGRRRVVIVDEADAMLSEAQNALLKTLEEPPSASMFVLVTSRPDELLPTVRSRCQRLRFGRLSAGDIAAVLMKAHDFSSADAHAAASAADGSIGLALEGGAAALVQAREAAAEVLQHVAGTRDPRRRLDSAKVLAGGGDRDELRRRLRALASMVRDLGAIGARADERCLANADLQEPLRELAGSFDRERVSSAFAAIDRALEAIDRNASPKIVADWLAFQL
jgi:DNA polymerase III subunit delta'